MIIYLYICTQQQIHLYMELFEQNFEDSKKNSIRNRILKLIEILNMDRVTFANSVNIKQATLSHILTGRNDPTLNIILQIHEKYPTIDINWLLYGNESDNPFIGNTNNNMQSNINKQENQNTEKVIYLEKNPKKITEIRVFYDDQTFDIFTLKPQNK